MRYRLTNLPLKAIQSNSDTWELEVLGVPNGGPQNGRDRHGEYFESDTELWYGKPHDLPVLHYHGLADKDAAELIGTATPTKRDQRGQWFRVVLDKTNATAAR